jgi:hypothetical protein
MKLDLEAAAVAAENWQKEAQAECRKTWVAPNGFV